MGTSEFDNEKVKINIKEDGIYLTLINNLPGGKPSRMDVIKMVEDFGVKDINFVLINEMFSAEDPVVERKITSNTEIHQEPEKMELTVDKSGLTAHVQFIPPLNGGPKLTFDDMRRIITEAGVRFGLKNNLLKDLAFNHDYHKPYLVAEGQKPTEGTDGYLLYHFNRDKKTRKPKQMEDGRVDYHNLDLFETVFSGANLVTTIHPVQGTDGMNVYNIPIPAKKVKPPQPLPRGKNTTLSEDGDHLYAAISGQINFDGKRLSISPLLEVDSVDNSTGNVHFTGSVVIKHNVASGFTVVAENDIEVAGVVEGANISAGGNVLIRGGVQGQEKAVITARGDITIKFGENCTLSAGGNVYADSLMHSTVHCDGRVELQGKKGFLAGGSIIAGQSISASIIGSPMATHTEIEVGFNPQSMTDYKALLAQYNSIKSEYDKMSTVVVELSAQNEKNMLSEEKKKILLKMIHAKMHFGAQLKEAKEKVSSMAEKLGKGSGVIVVSDVIRGGVVVTIGNAVLHVRDDIRACSLRNVDGKIVIGPYS